VSLKIVGQGAIELRVQTPSETTEQNSARQQVTERLDSTKTMAQALISASRSVRNCNWPLMQTEPPPT
jgi:hypothetical protein